MSITETTTFEISKSGHVPDATIERAQDRLTRVGRHCREDISHVEIRLGIDPNHRSGPLASAEATLTVKHGPVRAHQQASSIEEAVDGMVERLRRRLDRHESKLHRIGAKRHDGTASEGAWHHGDVRESPRHPTPIRDDADVIRRKSFSAVPMPIFEAAFDLDILDHDFYLFRELDTGTEAVLSYDKEGALVLEIDTTIEMTDDPSLPVQRQPGPHVLDLAGAIRMLDSGLERHVFHRPSSNEPAQVVYRRYDGHYGVIELRPDTQTQ